MRAISDVSEASVEGATDTVNMAHETNIVVSKANEVLEQTKTLRESASKLLEAVSIFKV